MGKSDGAAERHEQASAIFLRTCDLPKEEREAFLEEACARNPELREEVESLLLNDREAAESFRTDAACREVRVAAAHQHQGECGEQHAQQHRDHRVAQERRHVHGAEVLDAVMVGIDCDGFDVRADGHVLRVNFPEPVLDAEAARAALVELAKQARTTAPA